MKLQLEVITPEKIVYKEEVDEVVVPTENGEIAILPHHVNLVTKIAPGEMMVKTGKTEHFMAITGGLFFGAQYLLILAVGIRALQFSKLQYFLISLIMALFVFSAFYSFLNFK